jgi:hypothetical protein
MSYKTFFVRNSGNGWSNKSGHEIILYGHFCSSSAKSFKTKKFLILCEGDAKKGLLSKSPEYMYVQVDPAEMQRVRENLDFVKEKGDAWTSVNVCLEGRGIHNSRLAYSEVDYGS